LFINPSFDYITKKGKRHNRIWPPLSLLYCATIAKKQGNQVKLLDLNVEDSSNIDDFSKNFDLVFITSSTLDRWQCPNLSIEPVEKILKEIQHENLFLIGAHGTIMPEYFLKNFRIKAVILSEPEETVEEVCSGKDLSKIKGVVFKQESRFIKTESRPIIDMEKLPLPDYSLLPELKNYFYELLGHRLMLFEFSRSCPFQCIYCYKGMYSSKYRKKPAEQLFKEIENAVVNFGVKNAYFIDLEFTINRENVWFFGLIKFWTDLPKIQTIGYHPIHWS